MRLPDDTEPSGETRPRRDMDQARPRTATISLRSMLGAAADLSGRTLSGTDGRSLALAEMLRATSLGAGRERIAGRNVLLATRDQFLSAVALVELDGTARRIVLCPPDLPAEYLPTILGRGEIDVVVTDRPAEEFAGPTPLTIVPCSGDLVPAAPLGTFGRSEWVLLTSGTTGVPKMVAHDLQGLIGAIKPSAPGDAAPVWSTFYDIRRYGGLQIYLRGLTGNGSLVLSASGEPVASFLERLGRAGVTHLSGTPSHWRRALMSPALHAMAPHYVRLSGEIADQAVLDSLRAAFPAAGLGHAYASTEAGVAFEVTDGREGFPASLLDATDRPVEMTLRDGALCIRSARTASAYVGSPELALRDSDGFVDTGDMVERRGERCFFVGRRGGIINVGGLKVHPEEVESVLNAHPRVRMSLVTGRRSPITGAIVAAAIVLDGDPDEAVDPALRADILAHCRRALPPHKVPAVLRIERSLDVSEAGKLQRRSS